MHSFPLSRTVTPQDTPRPALRRLAVAAVTLTMGAACATTATPRPAPSLAAVRDSVRTVLRRALADSAFPGAYAVVGSSHEIYASMGVGHLDWAPSPTPDENTMWDMASLTKVIGTTSAVIQLYAAHRIDLDAPVQRYLPEFTGPHKELVTVRHLLTHSAGLPAWRPLYKEAASPDDALHMVYTTPLDTLPGVRMVYSDLGAILLGKIVERVSGEPLDRYLAEHVFAPLKMTSTMFRPPASLLPRIAPTERDPWRNRLVRGEVHDENAYFLGGVSGHAGLFSTGHDLARFAQMLLQHGTLDGVRVLDGAALDTFTTVQNAALSNRALGWEVPSGTNSAGHKFSAHAFGHTGFTGTSIWVDPSRDLFVILLTNRVDPTRANTRIGGVRIALADAVVTAVDAARPVRLTTSRGTP
jgi:CubicO group peptidase (beta-lactamase class C family)